MDPGFYDYCLTASAEGYEAFVDDQTALLAHPLCFSEDDCETSIMFLNLIFSR
jgi:hypothetical protein